MPALLGFVLGASNLRAERYLTATEAQKVCFPSADRFDSQPLALTRDQVKTLEERSKARVGKSLIPVWTAWRGTNFLGVFITDQVFGKHELIDYGVAISEAGKILQVEILEYREKYGGEVRKTEWRDQFRGKNFQSPFKLNGDIYNISGATISCRHVTEGIKKVLAIFEVAVRSRLVGRIRMPVGTPD